MRVIFQIWPFWGHITKFDLKKNFSKNLKPNGKKIINIAYTVTEKPAIYDLTGFFRYTGYPAGHKNIFRVNPETFPLTYIWNFENPSSHLGEKGTVASIDLKKIPANIIHTVLETENLGKIVRCD